MVTVGIVAVDIAVAVIVRTAVARLSAGRKANQDRADRASSVRRAHELSVRGALPDTRRAGSTDTRNALVHLVVTVVVLAVAELRGAGPGRRARVVAISARTDVAERLLTRLDTGEIRPIPVAIAVRPPGLHVGRCQVDAAVAVVVDSVAELPGLRVDPRRVVVAVEREAIPSHPVAVFVSVQAPDDRQARFDVDPARRAR